MIENCNLIELAARYLGQLKNDFCTFNEFDSELKALIDLALYDDGKDKIRVRDVLISIRQIGEKWK